VDERRKEVERALVRRPRTHPVLASLLQPADLVPYLHIPTIELERGLVGLERGAAVVEPDGYARLQVVQVGAPRRPGLCLADAVHGADRVSYREADPRTRHQHFGI